MFIRSFFSPEEVQRRRFACEVSSVELWGGTEPHSAALDTPAWETQGWVRTEGPKVVILKLLPALVTAECEQRQICAVRRKPGLLIKAQLFLWVIYSRVQTEHNRARASTRSAQGSSPPSFALGGLKPFCPVVLVAML